MSVVSRYGEDVVPPTIVLGNGWHSCEMTDDLPFRWIGEEATALVAVFRDSEHEVALDIEPGPSAASSIFVEIRERDVVWFAGPVAGRKTIKFVLPPTDPDVRTFDIKISGGGRPVPNDARILNARVYRFTVLPLPRDVVPRWRGFAIRQSWYRFEEDGYGNHFRWVNNDACIEVAGYVPFLELELEPGPGLSCAPFQLSFLVEGGRELSSHQVAGRERLRLDLPDEGPYPMRFLLHCEGGGRPALPDARILNFRVFGIPGYGARNGGVPDT